MAKQEQTLVRQAAKAQAPSEMTKVIPTEQEEISPFEKGVEQSIQELKQPTEGLRNLAPEAGTVKTPGVARKIETSAIEKGMTEGFGDLPEFTSTTRDYQIKGALKLVNEDYDTAKSIALGQTKAPGDLLPNVIFDAVRRKAEIEGDLDTIRDLARSPVTVQTSLAAQHLGMTGKFDEESPTALIQLVQNAREQVWSKKTNKAFEKERDSIANYISNKMDQAIANKDAWVDFIKSIECDY
jgi:hypothetical protein